MNDGQVIRHPEGAAGLAHRWFWYDDDEAARNLAGHTLHLRIGESSPGAAALVSKTSGIAGRTPADNTEHSATVAFAVGELDVLEPGRTYSATLLDQPGTPSEQRAVGLIYIVPTVGPPS